MNSLEFSTDLSQFSPDFPSALSTSIFMKLQKQLKVLVALKTGSFNIHAQQRINSGFFLELIPCELVGNAGKLGNLFSFHKIKKKKEI